MGLFHSCSNIDTALVNTLDEDRWLLDAELIMQATLDKEELSEKALKESETKDEELVIKNVE